MLHVDMDAFYVSVELLRRPELRGRPVVVGGSGDRGVVAAASYEARAYGVHSAMASVRARRLCPDAVFLPGDHALYGEVSARVMGLFRELTPLVEPLSLDEAFLDLTGSARRLGPAPAAAAALRDRVREREGLTCSVGVAPSKFLAKLASEAAKPRATPTGPVEGTGVVVVEPGGELAFLHPLPIGALWGVGPVTRTKLERLGVRTVGELAALPREAVVAALGRGAGGHLHDLSHARDDRPVVADQAARSISHEETFAVDLHDLAELRGELVRLADGVASRLRAAGVRGRTVQLKVRYGDFTTITRSRTLDAPTDRATDLVAVGGELLAALPVGRGVRLLGIGAANLTDETPATQLSLDGLAEASAGAADAEWDAVNEVVDAVRARFGRASLRPARLATRDDAPGVALWGPGSGSDPGRAGGDAPETSGGDSPGGKAARDRPGGDTSR